MVEMGTQQAKPPRSSNIGVGMAGSMAAQSALPWATAVAAIPGTVEVTGGRVMAGMVVVTAGRVVVTAGRVVVTAANVLVTAQEAGQAEERTQSARLLVQDWAGYGIDAPTLGRWRRWRWRRDANWYGRIAGTLYNYRYALLRFREARGWWRGYTYPPKHF